jgi:hypothetical protein
MQDGALFVGRRDSQSIEDHLRTRRAGESVRIQHLFDRTDAEERQRAKKSVTPNIETGYRHVSRVE